MPIDLGNGILFFTRSEWSARPSRGTDRGDRSQKSAVDMHYSAGNLGPNDDAPANIRAIQNYHMDRLGYADIAYNLIEDPWTGWLYEGRSLDVVGAHGLGRNVTAWGFCVVGLQLPELRNLNSDGYLGMVRGKQLLRQQRGQDLFVYGHRDWFATACPGNDIYSNLDNIYRERIEFKPPPPISFVGLIKEDNMELANYLVPIGPLDQNGNGWRNVEHQELKLDGNPVIVGTSLQGPYPPDNDYWYQGRAVKTGAQPRGKQTIISVENARPGSTVSVYLTVGKKT